MNQELKQIGLGLGGVIIARAISGLIPASKNPALIKIAFAGASGFGAYKVDNADVKALLVGASIGMGADALKMFAEKSEALQEKKAKGGTLNNVIVSAVGLGSPADMEEEFGLNGMVQGNDGVWYEVDETGLQGTYMDENGNVFENGLNATYVDEYGTGRPSAAEPLEISFINEQDKQEEQENINNPLAIFKSIKSGYVILTEIKNELNKALIVAIHFKKGFNVQDIRSIYSKTNDSTYKNWKKDGLLLYENKKSKSFARILGLIPSSANKMLSSNKDIQNNQNNQKKDKIILTKNTKVKNISQNSTVKSSYYKVAGDEGRFLQAVEKKPVHSVVITFDGEQGAGKTTTLYKFMNSFAQENKCLFISAEEHQDSYLAKEKTEKYLNTTAQKNIDIISDLENEKEFYNLINPYEIIFIDSWQKLQRMIGNIRLDEDLRKKFNGKVFVIIFQQTTTGRTKGGAEIVFDGDIIVKMNKGKTFSENYAYFDKNRYTKVPIETLKYNIEKGKLLSTEPIENKTNFSFKIN
jgi:hypothetical protein